MGSGAMSYMRKGLLMYEEMRHYLVIYGEAVSHDFAPDPLCTSLVYEENFVFFFISVVKYQNKSICSKLLSAAAQYL